MKEEKTKSKAGRLRPWLVIGLVIGIMVSYMTFPHPQLVQDEETGSWHIIFDGNLAQAAEANPGAGAGGILEIYFVNHSATNHSSASCNVSATIEGWCNAANLGYANADDFNVELAHSTAFDICIKVRGNETQCDRGGNFCDTDLRVRITSADLSIGADTVLTGTILHNDTNDDYLWMMFETKGDNPYAGFTLPKDASYDITSIKFEAYY
jgi:hypothetical protein